MHNEQVRFLFNRMICLSMHCLYIRMLRSHRATRTFNSYNSSLEYKYNFPISSKRGGFTSVNLISSHVFVCHDSHRTLSHPIMSSWHYRICMVSLHIYVHIMHYIFIHASSIFIHQSF